MNTTPGSNDDILKWWYFFRLGSFLNQVGKKDFQSYVGTTVRPSASTTSWTSLHQAERSTTSAMELRLPTGVARNLRLNNPKHQSGANFVWPTTKNDKVSLVCLLVMALQSRYQIIGLFLFCPVQLSAWRNTSVSPVHTQSLMVYCS